MLKGIFCRKAMMDLDPLCAIIPILAIVCGTELVAILATMEITESIVSP